MQALETCLIALGSYPDRGLSVLFSPKSLSKQFCLLIKMIGAVPNICLAFILYPAHLFQIGFFQESNELRLVIIPILQVD